MKSTYGQARSLPEGDLCPTESEPTVTENQAVTESIQAKPEADKVVAPDKIVEEAPYEVYEAKAKELLAKNSNLFMIGHDPHVVNIKGSKCSVDRADLKVIAHREQREGREELRFQLAKKRGVPASSFKVTKVSNANGRKLTFNFEFPESMLLLKHPPIARDVRDNAFIEAWLKQLFGEHDGFIRDWLAVYGNTNHRKLPILVLTGPQGSGKTTFANMVKGLFPGLGADLGKTRSGFTSELEAKVLLIDENDDATAKQYVDLKAITGREENRINVKYGPQYSVPNNASVIVISNSATPMYFESGELVELESQNRFFVKAIQSHEQAPDAEFQDKIMDRMGHYLRTVLKDRYAELEAAGVLKQNRFSIPCPITQLQRDLHARNASAVELRGEELYEALYEDAQGESQWSYKLDIGTPSVPAGHYVQASGLRELISAQFRTRSVVKVEELRRKLQEAGLLSHEQYRQAGRRLGYLLTLDASVLASNEEVGDEKTA